MSRADVEKNLHSATDICDDPDANMGLNPLSESTMPSLKGSSHSMSQHVTATYFARFTPVAFTFKARPKNTNSPFLGVSPAYPKTAA